MVALDESRMNDRSTWKNWIAPAGALGAGLAVVLVALLIPVGMLEDIVWNSGIAALVPAAAPPLGNTARALLALIGGGIVAAVSWSGLFLLFGPGGWLEPSATPRSTAAPAAGASKSTVAWDDDRAPTLRRADAHPDAPARRPLMAKDLGVPMPPVEVVRSTPPVPQDIPADLDQPLAAFDPGAVPAEPMQPVRPVAPLHMVGRRTAQVLADGERITSVELPSGPLDDGPPSIDSLLRRLEEGTRRPKRVTSV